MAIDNKPIEFGQKISDYFILVQLYSLRFTCMLGSRCLHHIALNLEHNCQDGGWVPENFKKRVKSNLNSLETETQALNFSTITDGTIKKQFFPKN